jgi:hypothetical protein
MNSLDVTYWIAWIGLGIGLLLILLRLRVILNRPLKRDLSRPQGSARWGILYAFTLGMAPWEKESTRLHWLAYLRGIFFHLGIFTAFGIFFISPWLGALPLPVTWLGLALTVLGALFGFAGIWLRLQGANERALSLPDDYFSVFLTSLFIALAALSLALPAWLPLFYLAMAVLCVYAPFSKIRHCVYFFYSKAFFGRNMGHRGVLGQSHEAEGQQQVR